MDIRILRYFLAVAREESISGAAKGLHLTQPTLSRQLMDLEEELGVKLLNRGKKNRHITLTEEGMLLRRRAEEIVALADKTIAEFDTAQEIISGDVYIGGGETNAMRLIAKVAKKLQAKYPLIRYHLYSGNADDVAERLDKGLLDFGLFIEPANMERYHYLRLPDTDTWGLLMRKDSPLSAKESIQAEDLENIPLIVSRQSMVRNELSGWRGGDFDKLNIVATYNLIYNASLMVDEGFGYALCLDRLVFSAHNNNFCFRPLEPKLEAHLNIAWKKYQVFSKAAEKFLEALQEEIEIHRI
ncbi:MAG: LysR family transcriptional regulator [Lachnospiraceae bacterium]|nr:LysR family transcriptional regulator [Lachnospiraceae bacterium]